MGGGGRTPYEVLGVARAATPEEIRLAYRLLVARYHPDRHQGNPLVALAAERAAELNRAYELLSDPVRRAAYDGERGERAQRAEAAAPRGGPAVARETRTLAVLLRALSLVVAVVLLARLVPFVGRAALGGLRLASEALGAPAGMLAAAALALAAVVAALLVRKRRSRRRPPG